MSLADYQNEIYLRGVTGELPATPVGAGELEAAARAALSPQAWGYLAGSAGSEETARANRDAFARWRIRPRMLRGVADRDTGVDLLGAHLPAPVLLAPIGVLGIVHPDADLAVARAAASTGVPMVVSTAASTPLEEVAAALGPTPGWYQLYWPRDRQVAASLVARAEAAGFAALVVTVDTPVLGWRPRDLAQAYLPFLTGQGIANYTTDPAFCRDLDPADPTAAVLRFVQIFGDPTLTWEDLAWLRGRTDLPLVLKGLQHPDDVHLAVEAGVDAVVCSNHGGRQVDGALGALDALPELIAAAAGRVPVLFDSGVRTGADVVKALALGAAAVLLGRPYAYGLALGGQQGVRDVVRALLAELDLTLGLSGCARVADLGPDLLVPAR